MGTIKRRALSVLLAAVLAVTMIPAEGLTSKAYAADPVAKLGVTYQGAIPKNKANYYTFTIPSAGLVTISGLAEMYDGDSFQPSFELHIYDANGKELWDDSSKIPSKEGEREYLNTSLRLGKGTYTLKIAPPSLRGVKYSFKLTFETVSESFAEAQGGSNNSFETASAISLNRTYRSQTGWDDSCDFYRFTLSRAQTVRVIFNTIAGHEPDVIALFDPNRVSIKQWRWTSDISGEAIELPAGTYFFKIDRDQWYAGAYSFQIADPISITKTSIKLSDSSYIYDGYAKTPDVIVTHNGSTLTNSRSYTVSYSANKSAGIGKVTVTGKGAYGGSVTKTFKIKPGRPSIKAVKGVKKGFKATWAKKAKAEATGYQVQYSTKKSMKGAKTKTVKGTAKTIKGLKAGKRYYVRVRAYKTVGKQKVYSSWSAKRAVTTKRR